MLWSPPTKLDTVNSSMNRETVLDKTSERNALLRAACGSALIGNTILTSRTSSSLWSTSLSSSPYETMVPLRAQAVMIRVVCGRLHSGV